MTEAINGVHGGRSDNVDALRFAAMVAVVAQHCELMPFGWLGVWLFYVISGFVVTKSLDGASGGQGLRGVADFYRRRILRIVPSYAMFVLVAALVLLALGRLPPLSQFGSLAIFDANVYMIGHGMWQPEFPMSHLWTLSVEMKFYAVAGIFLVLLKDRAKTAFLIAVILFSTFGRLACDLFSGDARAASNIHYLAVYQADAFATGSLLAMMRKRLSLRSALLLALAGLALLAIYVASYVWINISVHGAKGLSAVRDILSGDIIGELREVAIYTPLIVLFSGLVGVAYLAKGVAGPIMEMVSRWGRASYSGYLWHFAIIALCKAALSQLGMDLSASWAAMPAKFLLFVISVVLVIPVSLFFYDRVERPAARIGGSLLDGLVWPRFKGRVGRPSPVEEAP